MYDQVWSLVSHLSSTGRRGGEEAGRAFGSCSPLNHLKGSPNQLHLPSFLLSSFLPLFRALISLYFLPGYNYPRAKGLPLLYPSSKQERVGLSWKGREKKLLHWISFDKEHSHIDIRLQSSAKRRAKGCVTQQPVRLSWRGKFTQPRANLLYHPCSAVYKR